MMPFDGMSATDPAVPADAPPASDKDTPTAPNTGMTSFRPTRFEVCVVRGMSVLPCLSNLSSSPLLHSYPEQRHPARTIPAVHDSLHGVRSRKTRVGALSSASDTVAASETVISMTGSFPVPDILFILTF